MATYIINHNPENKEVHRTADVKSLCNINLIAPDHREDTNDYAKVRRLIDHHGYNGCYWCYRSEHTG